MRRPSRREFLSALAASLPLSVLRQAFPSAFVPPGGTSALFQPVPPTQSGITWKHSNGRSPSYYLPETTGAGCAFLDYDNDGWMDIYLVNSGPCDFFTPQAAAAQRAVPEQPRRNLHRRYRKGRGDQERVMAWASPLATTMETVIPTCSSPVRPQHPVSQQWRRNVYRRHGKAGIATPGWATSAVWFDYDNDGRLDLFVCRFVEFDKADNKFCGNAGRRTLVLHADRIYPHPQLAVSQQRRRNVHGCLRGNGNRSVAGQRPGEWWPRTSITTAGWISLSPTTPSQIFCASIKARAVQGDRLAAGVAYSADGRARSGMGVDAADFDQDGWKDLFVTNVDQEMYSLYRNNKDGTLPMISRPQTGSATALADERLGLKFFDYDNDGNSISSLPTVIPTTRMKSTPAASPIANRCFSFTTTAGFSRT